MSHNYQTRAVRESDMLAENYHLAGRVKQLQGELDAEKAKTIELQQEVALASVESPVAVFVEKAHELIDRFPFLYVEIARARPTDWMAWVCTHNRETHPDRIVLVSAQGSSPQEACTSGLIQLLEVIEQVEGIEGERQQSKEYQS